MKTVLKQVAFMLMLMAVGALAVWAQDEGKALYSSKCATCHGPDGAGKTAQGKKLKVKPVAEIKAGAEEMMKAVSDGKAPDMPAFKQFTKDQVKAVVDYYRSLAK